MTKQDNLERRIEDWFSYKGALEAAGAEVLSYKEFGDYQGTWWAKVNYNGSTLFITDYYGSCSGCDVLQGEIDSFNVEHIDDEYHSISSGEFPYTNCSGCAELMRRFVELGKKYLCDPVSFEDAIKKASEGIEWDLDRQEIVDWLKEIK